MLENQVERGGGREGGENNVGLFPNLYMKTLAF